MKARVNTSNKGTICIFGARGSLGSELVKKFEIQGFEVIKFSSSSADKEHILFQDINDSGNLPTKEKSIQGVIWAQGKNLSDSIYEFDRDKYEELMDANVTYILITLNALIEKDLLDDSSSLCVVSSIWQEISRQEKLSYSITKSALRGLVLSLANDLASRNIKVNAVLPGPIDNTMTRENLSNEQISRIEESSVFGKLINIDQVTETIFWLITDRSAGVTGQFVTIDNGFTKLRKV